MRRPGTPDAAFLSREESKLLGERFQPLRKAGGLVQADIAFVLGIGQQGISQLERGEIRWRKADAEKAAAEVGTTLEALLSGGA